MGGIVLLNYFIDSEHFSNVFWFLFFIFFLGEHGVAPEVKPSMNVWQEKDSLNVCVCGQNMNNIYLSSSEALTPPWSPTSGAETHWSSTNCRQHREHVDTIHHQASNSRFEPFVLHILLIYLWNEVNVWFKGNNVLRATRLKKAETDLSLPVFPESDQVSASN